MVKQELGLENFRSLVASFDLDAGQETVGQGQSRPDLHEKELVALVTGGHVNIVLHFFDYRVVGEPFRIEEIVVLKSTLNRNGSEEEKQIVSKSDCVEEVISAIADFGK